jgi:hypothetical protein
MDEYKDYITYVDFVTVTSEHLDAKWCFFATSVLLCISKACVDVVLARVKLTLEARILRALFAVQHLILHRIRIFQQRSGISSSEQADKEQRL